MAAPVTVTVEALARVFAQRFAESTGQPFVIENRPGASCTIGADLVAKSPRDGYTLLANNCAHTSNAAYYKKLPYDTLTDFAPVTQMDVTSGNLLVVHPALPVRSVKELITLAKARPGQINYASAGIGSPQHVTGALLAAMAGIQLTHVAYKGNPQAFTDVLGGHVEMMFVTPSVARHLRRKNRKSVSFMSAPRPMAAGRRRMILAGWSSKRRWATRLRRSLSKMCRKARTPSARLSASPAPAAIWCSPPRSASWIQR